MKRLLIVLLATGSIFLPCVTHAAAFLGAGPAITTGNGDFKPGIGLTINHYRFPEHFPIGYAVGFVAYGAPYRHEHFTQDRATMNGFDLAIFLHGSVKKIRLAAGGGVGFYSISESSLIPTHEFSERWSYQVSSIEVDPGFELNARFLGLFPLNEDVSATFEVKRVWAKPYVRYGYPSYGHDYLIYFDEFEIDNSTWFISAGLYIRFDFSTRVSD